MALAGLCSLTDLEAIPGRHIRLLDPSYVFALLSKFQENSTAQGTQRLAASRG